MSKKISGMYYRPNMSNTNPETELIILLTGIEMSSERAERLGQVGQLL